MAEVGLPLLAHREAALGDADVGSPVPELALWIVRGLALRLVGDQQLEHHGARLLGALAGALHHHAVARRADAGGGEDPLALDLDHAGEAVAVGAEIGRASCRERGCQYVSISVVAVSLKKQQKLRGNTNYTHT